MIEGIEARAIIAPLESGDGPVQLCRDMGDGPAGQRHAPQLRHVIEFVARRAADEGQAAAIGRHHRAIFAARPAGQLHRRATGQRIAVEIDLARAIHRVGREGTDDVATVRRPADAAIAVDAVFRAGCELADAAVRQCQHKQMVGARLQLALAIRPPEQVADDLRVRRIVGAANFLRHAGDAHRPRIHLAGKGNAAAIRRPGEILRPDLAVRHRPAQPFGQRHHMQLRPAQMLRDIGDAAAVRREGGTARADIAAHQQAAVDDRSGIVHMRQPQLAGAPVGRAIKSGAGEQDAPAVLRHHRGRHHRQRIKILRLQRLGRGQRHGDGKQQRRDQQFHWRIPLFDHQR